jgi:hypothetical protein
LVDFAKEFNRRNPPWNVEMGGRRNVIYTSREMFRDGYKNKRKEGNVMKYALLVHYSQKQFDQRDNKAAMAAAKAYRDALQAAGVFVAGAGFEPPQTATAVSVRDGKRKIHDGPHAETKEFLAGFGIIDVPNLEAALEWAARHPAAGFASVEVRPLLGSHFLVGAPKPS